MARRFLATLSFLAIWPGLYAAAAVIYITQLALPAPPGRDLALCTLMAFFTGVGAYLLDRIKLRDAWLDPADAEAHPSRFNFLARRSRVIRVLAVVMLAAAAAIAALHARHSAAASAALIAIPIVSALGVVLYAARPRRARPRVKDLLLIKNSYVAAGLTGFALLMTFGWAGRGDPHTLAATAPAWLFAAATLFPRVIADAVLCDLDDQSADARFGTVTLPTVVGRARAWNYATATRLTLATLLALIPIGPAAPRLAWAAVTALSTVALRLSHPPTLRDWVDARFSLEAAAVTLVVALTT